MNIIKYTHSCLYVEDFGKTYLFDPGIYSVQSGLNTNLFEALDYLLITHEHEDHMDINFIKQLISKFPNLIIKTNNSVVEILKMHGILASSESDENVLLKKILHEKLFDKNSPENVSITVNNKIMHVGDSFQINESPEILAFPIQAPWGSYVDAIEKIKSIKPKIVIPIHDWHWRDHVRIALQTRAKEFLTQYEIEFYELQDGKMIEI